MRSLLSPKELSLWDRSLVSKDKALDGFGHITLGGVGEFLADEITRATKVETRSITLSHLQRGGAPCAYDRRMGRYFGIAAIDLVVKEDFGKMVSFRNGRIAAVPFTRSRWKVKCRGREDHVTIRNATMAEEQS